MSRDVIGFDRMIRLRWLDSAALLAGELRDSAALRAAAARIVAADGFASDSQRKTANVVARIWWRVPLPDVSLRDEALSAIQRCPPEERVAFHWGMALLAFPLFRDVASTAGRLLRLQGSFKWAQLDQRISAEWGSRTTLQKAEESVMRSVVDWGVLARVDAVGVYEATCARPASRDTGLWLLSALARSRDAPMPINDLLGAPELFPFSLGVTAGEVIRSPRFEVDHQGQDMLVVRWKETS